MAILVEIGLNELTTHQQSVALEERRIDIGFGRLDVGEIPGLVHEKLIDEPLRLACSSDHVLASKSGISLAEIAAESLVLYPDRPRPSYADQILAIFAASKLTVTVVLEATDIQTALGLVAAGLGVTLVPASVAGLRRDDIVFVSVDAIEARSPLIVSYRKTDSSKLLREFLEFTRRVSNLR
jgi:LysR family transcriptional regulator, benzoate and cis,cis-muconate-responsive activator of ben and cat genes